MLTAIFQIIINLSLIGTVMIAGIFLIRGLSLKKGLLKSSSFVLLWMAILLRMMIPLSVPLPSENAFFGSFGIGWLAAEKQHSSVETSGEMTAFEEQKGQIAGINQSDGKVGAGRGTDGVADSEGEISDGEANTAAAGLQDQGTRYDKDIFKGNNPITIYDIIPVIWLIGAALMAAAFLFAWLLTISREKDATGIVYAGWQKIRSMAGINRDIPLKIRKESSAKQELKPWAPYVSGLFRPSIILPSRMCDDHNEHMDYILLHELTHIRHWDNLKKVIAAAALCLHWFNPVFWLCWILFQRDLECSCDEKVVKLLGDQDKKRYAESLYKFACESQNVLLCHFSSSGKVVRNRIKRILAGSPKRSFAGILSLGMASLLLITSCTVNPVMKVSEVPPAESFVVYAAPDGLYRTGFTADSSEKIFDGEKLSHPVLSQNGDMVMFRQSDTEPQDASDPDRMSLYVYHWGLEKGILLKESSDSYCAGPDDTFIIGTIDGKLLKVKFQTAPHDGADVLEYRTEDISVWPESVPQSPDIFVSYANPECSPDDKYLAYSVDVRDNRAPAQSGLGVQPAYYNGGLYVLDLQTGKTVTVAPSKPSTANDLGADPVPGPWSPDGKVLTVWDKPAAASLSADGVSIFLYHVDTGLKTGYGELVLAYNENISFSEKGSIAVLSGGVREMFFDKKIDLITDYSKAQAEFHEIKSISENGLIPAMPQLSADGKTLYFAAVKDEDVKKDENSYPLKRQLYSIQLEKTEEVRQITADPNYRNENPVLLKDEEHLVFGRANAEAYDGKMEIWIMNLHNNEETKLAEWTEPEPTDVWMSEKYDDFYGRGSWNGIFAIYDGTSDSK